MIQWEEIKRVAWCEPDWGYGPEGSDPYWRVNDIDIYVHGPASEESKKLLSALAIHLVGFDPLCVDKAVSAGYFDKENNTHLECWRRDDD